MRYENSKSVILTILVLVSIVLTWNLWTYQPNFEKMEKGKTVAEVTVSEKQEVQKIIKPDQVLYHIRGGHYGTTNVKELDTITREMEKWTFSDVKNYSGEVRDFKRLSHGDGNVELIYPGDIPIELYRSVLNFNQKKIPSFNFNRIVINVEEPEKDSGVVYFISSDLQQVYSSYISTANLADFTKNFYNNATRLPRYFAYSTSPRITIFLPDAQSEMMMYKYLPVSLNSEEFKDALFSDPSFVQRSYVPPIEEYANAFSKMSVNYDNNMLVYVNPTADRNYTENSYDLVKRSIDFVNEHGGWSDPYRFVSKNEADHTVSFRMYNMDGYPVFNDKGSSEITEIWGRDEVYKYIRPNISLRLPLTTETQKVTMPSGHDVLEFLQSQKNFRIDLLDQLVLGYRMTKDSEEPQLILLEPAWFYRYDKTWKQISMEDLGGMKHGLE